jgi:magnesium-protoporphyrin IX monomethyl ester (oxidative) cyclase
VNVLSEVDWLTKKFGADELHIQDDNFTKDKERAKSILDGFARRNLKWSIPNGLEVGTLDRDLLKKIKESGCVDLTIAIESGSPRVLKMINKPVDLSHAKKVIQIMRELGIYSKVFFMVGFPGETKEEIKKTIDFASELKADWSIFSIVNPLPGSELSTNVNPVFDNMGYANANISTPEFTPEYIQKTVYDANIKINFLENYNLNGRNIEYAIRDFKRISDRYPEHTIARESLRRALEKNLYHS